MTEAVEMREGETLMIRQAAEELGVPVRLLREMCNRGLIPQVRRDGKGRRLFTLEHMALIAVLLGLKKAGFKNAELKRYSRMYRLGEASLSERKAMMETKKRQLWQELEDKQEGIDFLERQVEIIDVELSKR